MDTYNVDETCERFTQDGSVALRLGGGAGLIFMNGLIVIHL